MPCLTPHSAHNGDFCILSHCPVRTQASIHPSFGHHLDGSHTNRSIYTRLQYNKRQYDVKEENPSLD